MSLKSVNPATGEVMAEFAAMDDGALQEAITKAHSAYDRWKRLSFAQRAEYILRVAQLLKTNAREYGEVMSREMGKPIKQAVAEAEKCAWVCEYYAEHAEKILEPKMVATDASESYIQYDPLGVVLAVMPWNFPFWQVLRAAAPILMAGNTMLLKHASNVPQCGMKIAEVFEKAGLPEGVFQYLPIGSGQVKSVLEDDRVMAATLTGSERAGQEVAKVCGEQIKPLVLELGGSDPFIVLQDADINRAAEMAVNARFQNCGQSCIAAKRFIVVESVYEEFLEKFVEFLKTKKVGDPLDDATDIGPLYAEQGVREIESQVNQSIEAGARLVYGGKRLDGAGTFFEPTVLADVNKGMRAYEEETFGPIAAIIKVADLDEALRVANGSRFGLGASIWTADIELAKRLASEVVSGAFFINGMVKSDPRLPFGGAKKSGVGRELAASGIKEFTNVRTVWVA